MSLVPWIVGGLAAAGIGALQTVFGLITAPIEIVNIIVAYYGGGLPAKIVTNLVLLVIVYVGFLLLSAYLRHDV